MKFLDSTGLSVLWNKIKSTFLPLSGGTMTGDIVRKTPNNTTLYSIGTNGNVNANEGTGWIVCTNAISNRKTQIQGGLITISGGDSRVEIYSDIIRLNGVSIIDEAITTEELNEVLV